MHSALGLRDPVSEALATETRLVLRQKKSWGEILTGFEAQSHYEICTEQGEPLGRVAEVSGGFFATVGRWMFKGRRPFELMVESGGVCLITVKRPWFWFFSSLEVTDGNGELLGRIEQRFGILRRRFELFDRRGATTGWVIGPLFHPWTFEIRAGAEDGPEVARIEKKWSGLLKEAFTDADNFSLTLPRGDEAFGKLVLAAAILMDFCYFENEGKKKGLLEDVLE